LPQNTFSQTSQVILGLFKPKKNDSSLCHIRRRTLIMFDVDST